MKTNKKVALGLGGLLASGLAIKAFDNRKDLGELITLGKKGYKFYNSIKPLPEKTKEEEERLKQYRKYVDFENERHRDMFDNRFRNMNSFYGRGMNRRIRQTRY